MNRRSRIPFLLLYILSVLALSIGTSAHLLPQEQHPLVPGRITDSPPTANETNAQDILPAFLNALDVLQTDYFAIWQGIYPTSIDWTSAVLGTFLSSALTTLSTSPSYFSSPLLTENVINKYFSQLIGSYFGQDAFALRQEAYDDMLWVVLGWLESIKFINLHNLLHFNGTEEGGGEGWYGKQYVPAFAHRARLFWDMASQGWDTTLCNGGMIWSPYLTPYKNAITNELYIAASISMFLYFPGDDNTSPFGLSNPPGRAHDEKYLQAAIEAYAWLKGSNMTDQKGLFVDGYHVSGWTKYPKNGTENTKCDSRNEMVYTYNQGVLLSGQRGLYEATAQREYLIDGHKLVADVIAATGWDLHSQTAPDLPIDTSELGKWQGLGRSGILEEACDAPGSCSQDGQTFKGIFFHHLTLFCEPLPSALDLPNSPFLSKQISLDDDRQYHANACAKYGPWIKHNALSALNTRNSEGRFGMWWGAPPPSSVSSPFQPANPDLQPEIPENGVDYRNSGTPDEWEMPRNHQSRGHGEFGDIEAFGGVGERDIEGGRDLNDRGRGRTVETQGGGVAVLRAAVEVAGGQ